MSPLSPLMDMTGLVQSMATGTYTVTRRTQSTVAGGIDQADGGSSTLQVQMSVQPMAPEMMDLLPEGTRISDARTLMSSTPLHTSLEDGTPADQVSIDGRTYEVQAIRDWQAAGGVTVAYAKRVDP